MTPLWEIQRDDFKIGGPKGTEIIMRLQEQVAPEKFTPLGGQFLFLYSPGKVTKVSSNSI